MKAEKLMRRVMCGAAAGVLAGGLLLPLTAGAATVSQLSPEQATITIPVTLINMQATCDVTFSGAGLGSNGGVYPLGTLTPGGQVKHVPFRAIVACKDVDGTETVSTALTASVKGGSVTNSRIRMLLDGQQNDKAPELWLETGGQPVPVDGITTFCQGQGLNRNECQLTPFTAVPGDSPGGQVTATVVFNVAYV
ncbi:UNVERIFIED_ORG: hypothetical protein FHU01_4468 [Citrobacter freundii]